MKITFAHKNKTYTATYRQINENEPLQANGIRMHLHGCVAKHEPDVSRIKKAMNENKLNIEIYELEVNS